MMILSALISNGKKELKDNVMLDPCSTSSYISEAAAEELGLQGQALNFTIAGTGGMEIRTRSCQIEVSVRNVDATFSSLLQVTLQQSLGQGRRKSGPNCDNFPIKSV